MKPFFRILIILLLPSALYASDEVEAEFYLRPGIFGGYDSERLGYNKSSFRLMLELGPRWSNIPNMEPLESISLNWRIVSGLGVRHAIGPGFEWKISENWSTTAMVALAFGRTRDVSTGIHAGVGLKYRNMASVDLLYYVMPPGRDHRTTTTGDVHSIYGGMIFYGKTATRITLAAAILLAVVVFSGQGLGGMNLN